MNYKELLDKYKNGNATKEEVKLIEEELSKHEAIEEYLSESYNIDFEKEISGETIKEETTFVKNKVNKKLRKVIVWSVSVVFLILFTIFYVASPIVNNFYYNPSQKSVGKYEEDLYYDLIALTELNLPGYGITGVAPSDKLGFGVYNIYFQRENLFTGEEKDIFAKVKRNRRIGSFIDFFSRDNFAFESVRTPNNDSNNFLQEKKNRVINHIKELNPHSYISSYVVFNKDLNMKELDELIKKYNDKICFRWVGVRTEKEGKPVRYLSGFKPSFNDGSVSGDSADNKKYPYLQLEDWINDTSSNKNNRAEAYTKHYTSLLKYMNDRQEAVKALDQNNTKIEFYKNALNYANTNGVNTYGVLIYGEARDLLEFINNEKINTIEIDNVLASKKHIN